MPNAKCGCYFPIGRQRPRFVWHLDFDGVAGFTQRRHRRDDDVAEVLGVFHRIAVFVLQRLGELVRPLFQLIDELRQAVEQFLALH